MRIIYSGATYHIIQKGNNFEPIFIEDADRLLLLHLLKEAKGKFFLTIHAFCFMDNHIHILLKISKENLSQAMHWLFMSYAKKITGKYKRKGHLFTSRYKSLLCLNDKYFLQLSRYIHLNPVKAGLIKDPFSYRWSSCNLFKPGLKKKSFVETDFTLSFFGGNNNQCRAYKEFIEQGIGNIKNLRYPPVIFKNIVGRMDDLLDVRNKGDFKYLVRKLGIRESKEKITSKDKERVSFLNSSKRFHVAARDYLIFQKRKQGQSIKEISREMQISQRTVIRANRKVEKWISSYTNG